MASDSLEHERTILRVFGKRTHLIERRGISDYAETADAPIGGLQTYDSTERRGQADRTAGVSTERGEGLIRGHGCGRSAGRATRYPRGVPGVAAWQEG